MEYSETISGPFASLQAQIKPMQLTFFAPRVEVDALQEMIHAFSLTLLSAQTISYV